MMVNQLLIHRTTVAKGGHGHKKVKTDEELDAEWKERFGPDGARFIREMVDRNVADYEYLKQFALKV